MATFAIKLTLAAMPIATCFAVAANSPTSAETRTVVLTPAQHTSSHKKLAYASAKWLSVKSDRGAEVLIAESDNGTAIRVLSGSVTVRNQLDHSVIKLGAGMGYELDCRTDAEKRAPAAYTGEAAETIALFESKSNTSYLYKIGEGKIRAEIINPPLTSKYLLGDIAAAKLPMSRLLSVHFPPAGVVVWHPPVPALAEGSKTN